MTSMNLIASQFSVWRAGLEERFQQTLKFALESKLLRGSWSVIVWNPLNISCKDRSLNATL